MKYTNVLWFILLLPLTVNAQSTRQILARLDNETSDSSRTAAYQELVRAYRFSNEDSARFFAQQGLAWARAHSYRPGEARMLLALAAVNDQHGHLETAREQYTEARMIFGEVGDTIGIAETTNGLGVVAGRTGKYDEAMRLFLEALNLFEKTGSKRGVMQTYIKLGVVNDFLGDLDKSLEYYLEAAKLNEIFGDARSSATLLNNIGVIYGKRSEFNTALRYFRKGLTFTEGGPVSEIHIILLSSIGLAYDKIDMDDSAWHYQQLALSSAREINMPELEARSLVNLAALLRETDPRQSLELLERALTMLQSISHLTLITEVYEAMIDVHKDLKEFNTALVLTEKRQAIKDSLFSLQKAKEIANLIATQELARQENEMRSLEMRTEKSIMQRNIMIVVSILALAMVATIWYYNRKIFRLNGALVRKQRELKESNAIKDKLFSILGHDLRAPLGRVIGLLGLLSMRNPSAEEQDIIDKLRHQASITLETLDNLLAWGRRQLKGIRLHQQIVDVRAQLNNSIMLNEDYARQKNVTIETSVPDDLRVHVDPVHFDFVIRNLVSNAIKFSHSGGSVTIKTSHASEEYVVFAVADSGVGMSEEMREEIFNAGAKSAPGTWNEKGTGIALMLCREYITQNGGFLWVESSEGEGSTFYFTLRKHRELPEVVIAN